MLRHMHQRLFAASLLCSAPLWLASCGTDGDVPVLAGTIQASSSEGEALFQKAKQADDAGKTQRAIKLYDQSATRHPLSKTAGKARFRQAELLEQQGKIEKSFEAYDQFLQFYPADSQYSSALSRQAAMAQSAAEGDIKSSFLGLKSKLSLDKTVEMLTKVSKNAPKSRTASKAQFTIGELYQAKKKPRESIAAYRELVRVQPESPEAPEALFRVGLVLMEEADRGNQSQSTLDLAREAFTDYMIQYPNHGRNAEAKKLNAALSGRDIQRSYEIAEFYLKTGKVEAAKVYYRDIVKTNASGEHYEAAKARLKELGE